MSETCKHEWRLLDKTVMPSPLDKILQAAGERGITLETIPKNGMQSAVITLICCCKCGATQKDVTLHPAEGEPIRSKR